MSLIFILTIGLVANAQLFQISKQNISQKSISVKSSEQTVSEIVQLLQTKSPQLTFTMQDASPIAGSYTKAVLVTQITYKGKEVAKAIQKDVPLFAGNNTLTLSHFQVEKLLIETLEKQTSSSTQVSKRSFETTNPNLRDKLPSTETKGFTRRQIGRIPKDQYEVRLSILPEGNEATTQPIVFLVNII